MELLLLRAEETSFLRFRIIIKTSLFAFKLTFYSFLRGKNKLP